MDMRLNRIPTHSRRLGVRARSWMHFALLMATRRVGLSPQIAREAGWSFVIRALYAGLTFLTTVMLARHMGAPEYGIYAYAYSLIMLITIPIQVGLPNLIVRETARGMIEGRSDLVQGLWRWSGRLVAILTLAMMLLAIPLLPMWRGGVSSTQGLALVWAFVLVPLLALGNLPGAALRGLKQIVAGQLPQYVIRPALFVGLLIGVSLLVDQELAAPSVMALHVSAALIALVVGAWMLWQKMPSSVRQAAPSTKGRVWLTSSMLFALLVGFQVINKNLSTVVLGLFEAPEQVGIYRVAVQVSVVAAFGLQAVNMVVAPRFADLYAQGKIRRLQHLATSSARVALGFNLILTALIVLLGKQFFGLVFGREFAASHSPLLILLTGQMVNSAAGSVGILLNMTGHERDTVHAIAVGSIINISLNLLLIPLWGILGAAIATATSMAVWNALLFWKVRTKLGISSLAFRIPIGSMHGTTRG